MKLLYKADVASRLVSAPAVCCRVYPALVANAAILPSNVLGLHWVELSSIVEVHDTRSGTDQGLDVSTLWLVGRVELRPSWPVGASAVLEYLQGQRAGSQAVQGHMDEIPGQ